MIGSVITSVITTIVTNPAWGLGGLFIQLASIDPVLEVVERILGGTEISLFCTRLQKKSVTRPK